MKKRFQKFYAQNSEIEYWNSIYDRQDFVGNSYRQRMEMVLSWLDDMSLSENSLILEAGCGAGRFAHEAAKRGYHVFGMDYSQGMIAKAGSICNREDERNVAFSQGDIESLPFKDSSFDVIVCLGVVTYLQSEHEALHEFARTLKPGGMLAISIVNKARLADRMDVPLFLMHILKRLLHGITTSRIKSAQTNRNPSITTYFIPHFLKSLERAGFSFLEYRTVPWKLLTFAGKEVFPKKMAIKITLFFEQFSNVPFFGSFGGMCIFKVKKNLF